jgi:2-keto-4-pentenoate hydratase
MEFDEQAAIEFFWSARQRGVHFPPEWFDRLTLEQAYRIQLGLIDRRCAHGERHIGWKVGLTAKPIQEQFGFHEPVFGCILESQQSGQVFRPGELINPGFESELCLRIKHPLAGEVNMADARGAVEAVYPALEIIETRGDFVRQIALALADNAQQKTIILGSPFPLGAFQLEAVTVTVRINDQTVATGSGNAVLGNPLNSVIWLARKLTEFGRGIRAGDLIMTGSFTRQFPIEPGDRIDVDFTGIGSVETRMIA